MNWKKRSIKGCIANVPDIFDIPYFNLLSYENLKTGLMSEYIYGVEKGSTISPTALMGSLISPKVQISLKPYGLREKLPKPMEIFLSKDAIMGIESTSKEFNLLYAKYEKSTKLAFVDLNTLYKK